MSAATESNSGTIFMINRNNYEAATDIKDNCIYLVRENSAEDCKFISMYLGHAIQADVLDITNEMSYNSVTEDYDIPIQYQVEGKLYLHKDGDFFRVFAWNKHDQKYIDCLGANSNVKVVSVSDTSEITNPVPEYVYINTANENRNIYVYDGTGFIPIIPDIDVSQFVTKDENGNVVITGTLSSGDFTSSGDISTQGTIAAGRDIVSGGNVTSSTGAALTTQRDSISGTIGQHYVDACLPSNGYEVLLSNSATGYAEIIDVEISDISTMVKGDTTTDRTNDYCCTYIFRKSAATTEAEDLFTNFTSANTSETTDVSNNPPKIYLLNPDIDISQFTVIHVFVFYDGIAVCAIVGGYEYTFPVQP